MDRLDLLVTNAMSEKLLTGDTKTQVEAAVLAKYPNATIERTETDSDGVYESHIVTSDGQHLVVQVDKDYKVTGTQQCGPDGKGGPDGQHGPEMMGDHDGDGPQGAPQGGQQGDRKSTRLNSSHRT